MLSILGEFTGKILSTRTPFEIFLTVKDSLTLEPLSAITVPSKT